MRIALAVVSVASLSCLAGCSCSERDAPQKAPVAAGIPAPSAAPSLPKRSKRGPARVEAPKGYQTMTVGGVAPTPRGNAVVLTDAQSKVGVLIFVGGTEALSLALRLQHRRYDRPLTHDLLDSVVKELDGSIIGARVDKLENNVFHGTLVVHSSGRNRDIDARPSDALALAVGASAPIFVADSVIEQAGIDLSQLDVRPPDSLAPGAPPEDDSAGVEL